MLKISYAGYLGLSPAISVQNRKNSLKPPILGFTVI